MYKQQTMYSNNIKKKHITHVSFHKCSETFTYIYICIYTKKNPALIIRNICYFGKIRIYITI